MKIDIIIPVHNQLEFTKKCLESLYEFTDQKSFEALIVNNGSKDGTIDWLLDFGKNKRNLKFIDNLENIGWVKALNQGIKYLGDSSYILWCNNDVVFEEDWLPKMVAHFGPGIGAVGPTSNYVNGRQRIELNDGSDEERVQWLIGFFLMFRRDVIDAVGEVDERFDQGGCEEWDYIIRMQQKLGLGCVIARDVYIHHFGSRTIMNTVASNREEYSQYCKDAIETLKDKWGKEFIEKWINQELSVPFSHRSGDPWPVNCKLGWAIPHTWPSINYNTHLSLMTMHKPTYMILEAGSGGELDRKREEQIEIGMKSRCTHFFIADGDMLFPQTTLIDLFKLLNDGADIAGGLCYRGYPPYEPVVWHPTERRLLSPFKDFQFGDVIEPGASGAACLLVKREVFEKLPRPWFYNKLEGIFDGDGKKIHYQEGDHYFTSNAVRAGFKYRVMTKYDIGHLREFPVNRELWMIHNLLGRCGDWATIVALFKKLGDKRWIEREIKGGMVDIDWDINQNPYEIGLLYNFLLGKRITNVIEIGTQKGGTALLWAHLVKPRQGHVLVVDDAFQRPVVYENDDLRERIVEIEGNSHDPATLRKIREWMDGASIDFLFIDGDHSYEGARMDFEMFSPLVKKGGFVAFHDILDTENHQRQNCYVSRLWSEIKDRYNHFEIIDPNDRMMMGIGVLQIN